MTSNPGPAVSDPRPTDSSCGRTPVIWSIGVASAAAPIAASSSIGDKTEKLSRAAGVSPALRRPVRVPVPVTKVSPGPSVTSGRSARSASVRRYAAVPSI